MFNIFTEIKSIYKKQSLNIAEVDSYHNIAQLNWLIYDESNILILKELAKYFYYLTPELFLQLIYICIPKKEQPPFLHKIEKETVKANELYDKIKLTLRWSDRELKLHSRLLDKVIDTKYWKIQLGV
jgi:hypothetical protein